MPSQTRPRWPIRYEGVGISIHIPVKQLQAGGARYKYPRPQRHASSPCAARANAGSPLLTGRWRTLRHTTASPGELATRPRRTHLEPF